MNWNTFGYFLFPCSDYNRVLICYNPQKLCKVGPPLHIFFKLLDTRDCYFEIDFCNTVRCNTDTKYKTSTIPVPYRYLK